MTRRKGGFAAVRDWFLGNREMEPPLEIEVEVRFVPEAEDVNRRFVARCEVVEGWEGLPHRVYVEDGYSAHIAIERVKWDVQKAVEVYREARENEGTQKVRL